MMMSRMASDIADAFVPVKWAPTELPMRMGASVTTGARTVVPCNNCFIGGSSFLIWNMNYPVFSPTGLQQATQVHER